MKQEKIQNFVAELLCFSVYFKTSWEKCTDFSVFLFSSVLKSNILIKQYWKSVLYEAIQVVVLNTTIHKSRLEFEHCRNHFHIALQYKVPTVVPTHIMCSSQLGFFKNIMCRFNVYVSDWKFKQTHTCTCTRYNTLDWLPEVLVP